MQVTWIYTSFCVPARTLWQLRIAWDITWIYARVCVPCLHGSNYKYHWLNGIASMKWFHGMPPWKHIIDSMELLPWNDSMELWQISKWDRIKPNNQLNILCSRGFSVYCFYIFLRYLWNFRYGVFKSLGYILVFVFLQEHCDS